MKAHVWVMPKRTVLDPQGQTIQHALSGLGYAAVKDVRQGKFFVLNLEGCSHDDAQKQLERIANEVLTNPVIEECRFEIVDKPANTMNKPRLRTAFAFALSLGLWMALTMTILTAAGCKSGAHTSDPHLHAIDELLDKQIPKGTRRNRVEFFLNTRGFPQEDSADKNAIVAVVHHVDTETLQPSTARVTFHFDANDRLVSYELAPALNILLQP